jgi:hypothetical protein
VLKQEPYCASCGKKEQQKAIEEAAIKEGKVDGGISQRWEWSARDLLYKKLHIHVYIYLYWIAIKYKPTEHSRVAFARFLCTTRMQSIATPSNNPSNLHNSISKKNLNYMTPTGVQGLHQGHSRRLLSRIGRTNLAFKCHFLILLLGLFIDFYFVSPALPYF